MGIDIEMAAARPVHFVPTPEVCQENVEQEASWHMLQNAVIQTDLTVTD